MKVNSPKRMLTDAAKVARKRFSMPARANDLGIFGSATLKSWVPR